jgi:hypothetical protein
MACQFCWFEAVEFNARLWTECMRLKCQWVQPSGRPVVGVWFIIQWYLLRLVRDDGWPAGRPNHPISRSLSLLLRLSNVYFTLMKISFAAFGSDSSSSGIWHVPSVHRHWRAEHYSTRTLYRNNQLALSQCSLLMNPRFFYRKMLYGNPSSRNSALGHVSLGIQNLDMYLEFITKYEFVKPRFMQLQIKIT